MLLLKQLWRLWETTFCKQNIVSWSFCKKNMQADTFEAIGHY